MKRTFVLLITTLSQAPFSYAEAEVSTLDIKPLGTLPALSSPVKTLPAIQAGKPDLLLHAQLKVRQGILLSSEMSGRINRLALRNGEHFKAGQMLANFSCPKEELRLVEVRTKLDNQQLVKQEIEASHSINTLEIDSANAAWEEAKADVQVAEALLGRCTVSAPFAGKVTKLFAKSSQTVRTGDSLMEVVDENNKEVELLIPAHEISQIKLGQHYQISQDKNTKPYTIELTSLGGRVDAENQTVKIYGRIADMSATLLPPAANVVALISQAN